MGYVVGSNNAHPVVECSNKGVCDRKTGTCFCDLGFDGLACERTTCPNDCSFAGICMTQKLMAEQAGRTYTSPWDAEKHYGCVCDMGHRGIDCSECTCWTRFIAVYSRSNHVVECPTGPDVLNGYGGKEGRDCSGRGICDYKVGVCICFTGFYGAACEHQVIYFFVDSMLSQCPTERNFPIVIHCFLFVHRAFPVLCCTLILYHNPISIRAGDRYEVQSCPFKIRMRTYQFHL